jgi:leucyl-tRNA synthetase
MTSERYNARESEPRWQRRWDERGIFTTRNDDPGEKYHELEIFPYPSGRIQVGDVRNSTLGDVIARYMRARGHDAPHPTGRDAFGPPAENAAMEGMSKSKRGAVDPDDIIEAYGADVARWFMLSDSPPGRDVIWSDERVRGASRFVQRLWRVIGESAEVASTAPTARPAAFGAEALALRKAAHGALDKVSSGIEKLHFNVCLAHIREFTSVLADTLAHAEKPSPDLAWATAEAAVILVQLFAPMMPHLAEECWVVLGRFGLVSEVDWPKIERDLLVEDSVTLVVQVNGKKRGDVTVPRNAQNPEIETAVLELDAVKAALGGKPVRKMIVVPKRIVNVVG